MKYSYYALFTTNNQGSFEVTFPDLAPHVATFGNNLPDAQRMAADALVGYLMTAESLGIKLPQPSSFQDLTPDSQQRLIPIEVDTKSN